VEKGHLPAIVLSGMQQKRRGLTSAGGGGEAANGSSTPPVFESSSTNTDTNASSAPMRHPDFTEDDELDQEMNLDSGAWKIRLDGEHLPLCGFTMHSFLFTLLSGCPRKYDLHLL
jgi:hypothetical protein